MVVDQTEGASTSLIGALAGANYCVAGPFSECSDASNWLTNETPDGALLDMLLTDDTCFRLAQQLRSLGVPYLFHTGQASSVSDVTSSARVPPLGALLSTMSELIKKGSN
jgi:DNA-binding response OmpR family regulator